MLFWSIFGQTKVFQSDVSNFKTSWM